MTTGDKVLVDSKPSGLRKHDLSHTSLPGTFLFSCIKATPFWCPCQNT